MLSDKLKTEFIPYDDSLLTQWMQEIIPYSHNPEHPVTSKLIVLNLMAS